MNYTQFSTYICRCFFSCSFYVREVGEHVMKNRKLTPKQQKFADYYIKTGNATESAIKAGYSKKTAAVIGAENLIKPNIKSYIDERMKELADKRIMGMQEALELLTSIARGEMTEEVIVTFMDGYEKVKKTPDIKERLKAIEQILKRFVINENDELRNKLLEAQIDKTKAEIDKINKENTVDAPPQITIIDEWSSDDE